MCRVNLAARIVTQRAWDMPWNCRYIYLLPQLKRQERHKFAYLALKNCFAHAHSGECWRWKTALHMRIRFTFCTFRCRSRPISDVKFWPVLQLRGWRKRWRQLFCFNAPTGYTNWISGWLRHILQVKRLGTVEKCLQKRKVIFLDDVLVILNSISTLFNFPIIQNVTNKEYTS